MDAETPILTPEPAASHVRRFRKRPVTVSAILWTGDNEAHVREFTDGLFNAVDPEDRADDPDITGEVLDKLHSTWVGVKTGHWVVRGIKGEFYPLDDEVRLDTYDPADGPDAKGNTPAQVFRDTLTARRKTRSLPVDTRPWAAIPEEDKADLEAAVQDAMRAGGSSFTEWAVFWGGEHPDDCAGLNVYSDEAEAEEDLQWTVSAGLAERDVSHGSWRVITPPDVAAAELATARADAQRNADLVTELRRRIKALERAHASAL